MSFKLGRPGALVGWGGGAEGRPERLTDLVRLAFLCMVFCRFFVLSWANPPPAW